MHIGILYIFQYMHILFNNDFSFHMLKKNNLVFLVFNSNTYSIDKLTMKYIFYYIFAF